MAVLGERLGVAVLSIAVERTSRSPGGQLTHKTLKHVSYSALCKGWQSNYFVRWRIWVAIQISAALLSALETA
jgi:cobalamin biosynthesis protein CbiG